jgi:Type I restriction enzyme HindI endonuclease subunit-like, C-terminal
VRFFPVLIRVLQHRFVKRLLRKYDYPPDKQEKATQTVLCSEVERQNTLLSLQFRSDVGEPPLKNV